MRWNLTAALGLVLISATVWSAPDGKPFGPAQAAADEMMAAASADLALLPDGMIRSEFKSGDLSKLLQFPSEHLAVCKVRGSQIQGAFQKAVSLYPSPNSTFLQIAGAEVTFDLSAPRNSRVQSILIGGKEIELNKTYDVVMPISLARGAYGYFSFWDRDNIDRELTEITLGRLLKGKTGTVKDPRWVEQK